ncbi:MAG: glycosyltransferase family 4 protein [Pirellulales bacterium]
MHVGVLFTYRMSLQKWSDAGLLERELAIHRRLVESGVRVTLITYGNGDELAYTNSVAPIQIACNRWRIPRRWYAGHLALVHSRLLRDCDLIRTNQMEGADAARRLAQTLDIPWIARSGYLWADTVRQLKGTDEARSAYAEEDRGYRHATRISVTTREMAQTLSVKYPECDHRIRVVPNYVDTSVFTPGPPAESPVDVVFVGRLSQEKNLPVLLEALRGRPWRALIIGDGPERNAWQTEFADLGEQVSWLGSIPNQHLPGQLARASLMVLPSLLEGHPKAVFEAMACGVPVVVADRPGLRDAVQHHRTGWHFDGTATGLRQALDVLLSDSALRKRLATDACERVRSTLSLDRIVQLELSLYEETLRASR